MSQSAGVNAEWVIVLGSTGFVYLFLLRLSAQPQVRTIVGRLLVLTSVPEGEQPRCSGLKGLREEESTDYGSVTRSSAAIQVVAVSLKCEQL